MTKFESLFKEFAWVLLTLIGGFASWQFKELTSSVAALNTNVAVLVERTAFQDKAQSEMKQRIDAIQLELSDLRRRR